MAAALPYSRGLSKQLLSSTRLFTRSANINPLSRVTCYCATERHRQPFSNEFSTLSDLFNQARTYATAAKPTRKPTASTTRTVTKKRTKTTTKTPAKKKAAKKPKKKTVKKTVKTTKSKAKKPPSKTAVQVKERAARADLRAAALLDVPKQLPATAYLLVSVAESKRGLKDVRTLSSAASARYKNLSAEEREVCICCIC